MSYQKRVLKDNPSGFWCFENGHILNDISSGYWTGGSTRTLNNATSVSGTYSDILPIVSGSISALKVPASTVGAVIPNTYDILYKTAEKNAFSLEFWLAFDTIPTNTEVLSFTYSLTKTITLSFADNYVYLKVSVSDKTRYSNGTITNVYVLKMSIDSYESQKHVVINYKDKSFWLTVNGKRSEFLTIGNSDVFPQTITTLPNIVIGSTANTDYFLIDSLAIYNYNLTIRQIKSHIYWGLYSVDTKSHALRNNGGQITFDQNDGVINNYKIFNSNNSWSTGLLNNLVIENGNLTFKTIKDLTLYGKKTTYQFATFSTVASEKGFTTYDDTSLSSSEFSNLFNPAKHAITARVYISTSRGSQVSFLSASGFSFGTLIVAKTSDHKIKVYSPEGGFNYTSSAYASSQWVDVKVYFINQSMYVSLNTGAANKVDTLTRVFLNDSSSLYIGNSYETSAGVITNYPALDPIRLFKVYDIDNIPSSLVSPTTTPVCSVDLSNTLNILPSNITDFNTVPVEQYGDWQTAINFGDTESIVGTKIHYGSSSKNTVISTSSDSVTYTSLSVNGEQIPSDQLFTTPGLLYVKISMQTQNSQYAKATTTFAEFSRYTSLNKYSDGFRFDMSPINNTDNAYVIKSNTFNLLARDFNFGTHFEPATGSQLPGRANLLLQSDTRTLEFFFRMDTKPGATTNASIIDIIKVLGGSPSISLIYQPSSDQVVFSGWDSVFINGKLATSPYPTALDEIYHFVGIVSGANPIQSGDTIILNGKNTSSSGFHAHGTYSNINMYSDAKDSDFSLKRYLMNIGINSIIVNDSSSITISEYSPRLLKSGVTFSVNGQ